MDQGSEPALKKKQQVSLGKRHSLNMTHSPFFLSKEDTRSHSIPCTGIAQMVRDYLGVAFIGAKNISVLSQQKQFFQYAQNLDAITQKYPSTETQGTNIKELIPSELKRLASVVQGYLADPQLLHDKIPETEYGARTVLGHVVTPVGLVLIIPPNYSDRTRSRFKKIGDGVYAVSQHLVYEAETNIMMLVSEILSDITQGVLQQNSRSKGAAQSAVEAVTGSMKLSSLREISPSDLVDSLSSSFASALPKMACPLWISRHTIDTFWAPVRFITGDTDKPLLSSVYPSQHDQVVKLDAALHGATKALSAVAKQGATDAKTSHEELCEYTEKYESIFNERSSQLHRMIFIAKILGPRAMRSLQAQVIATPPSRYDEIDQELRKLCGESSYRALRAIYEILESKPFSVESMDRITGHMNDVDQQFHKGFSAVLDSVVTHLDSSTRLAPKDIAELNTFLKQVSRHECYVEHELARKGLLEILERDKSYGFTETANALKALWSSDSEVHDQISQSLIPDLFDAPVYVGQFKNMWKRRNGERLPSRSEVVGSPLVELLGYDARSKNRLMRMASKAKEIK
jgi:hypothetical protein